MPFVPVPNTVMIELLYTQDNQQLENTLYFEMGDPVSVGEATVIAEAVIDWWVTNMQALTSNTVSLRAVKATALDSATAPSVEVPPATPQTGSVANPATPNSTTLAIKFLTALRGRSARGRNYVVGLTENTVIGNQVDAAHAEAIRSAYEELIAFADPPIGATWVVVSRFLNGNERLTGLTTPITGVALTDLIVDSQRRRLPGRGR